MSDRIPVTLTFQSADLSDDALQADVEELLPQLQEIDGVKEVDLVPIGAAPEGSKALGGFVPGALKFTIENSKILTGLLGSVLDLLFCSKYCNRSGGGILNG